MPAQDVNPVSKPATAIVDECVDFAESISLLTELPDASGLSTRVRL
jgi:hypothetical protein